MTLDLLSFCKSGSELNQVKLSRSQGSTMFTADIMCVLSCLGAGAGGVQVI